MAGMLAVGTLVAAGCGSDDDKASSTTAAATTTAASTATTAAATTTAAGGAGTTAAPATTAGGSTATTGGGSGTVDDKPLVIARNMDLVSGDPSRAVCDTCQFVFNSLYQTLVGLDRDNKTLTPLIAKSWDVNDDSTEYTFHLDPAAKFSDGSPVESKDVAFSLLRLKNLKVSLTYLVDDIKSIDTSDPATAVITLSRSNSEFLNNMNAAYAGIINSDVVISEGASDADDADAKDTAEAWFISHSAGSGPYVLDSFAEGDQLTLKANTNYWRDPAPVSTVIIRQAETAAAQAQMLQTGEADIAMQIDPITAKSLDGVDGVTVETIPSFNFFWLGLAEGTTEGTSHPLDAKVRQAISMAIDYQALIDTLVDGKGKLQASPIPNGFPGSDGLEPRTTDVEGAKKLLEEAGVTDGMTLKLGYPTINAYGVDFGQLAQVVQQDLDKIGIKLELDPQTFSVMIDEYRTYKLPSNLLYWAPDYFGSSQYVGYFGNVDGSTWSKHVGGGDDTPVVNDKENAAYNKALASTDEAERAAQYKITGQEMINDNAVIPLFSPDLVLAYRTEVKGVFYSACCNIYLDQLSRG
jgi:peptide/nickel transport system substrate-binding protein